MLFQLKRAGLILLDAFKHELPDQMGAARK
jgi:hypothetical protein